jgi:hypothetical protein
MSVPFIAVGADHHQMQRLIDARSPRWEGAVFRQFSGFSTKQYLELRIRVRCLALDIQIMTRHSDHALSKGICLASKSPFDPRLLPGLFVALDIGYDHVELHITCK